MTSRLSVERSVAFLSYRARPGPNHKLGDLSTRRSIYRLSRRSRRRSLTTLALKASLALWTRRARAREHLRAVAQQDLDEARARNDHPRQRLVDRLALRDKQLADANAIIERRQQQLALKAENTVRRPYEIVKMDVRNQSGRNGSPITLIVLHDTEGGNVQGTADLEGVGAWFDNPAAQASSHVCVDAEGHAARYVKDQAKAWHVMAYNSRSLGIEQIGFASQTVWPVEQVETVAKYVAYWSRKYGIPVARSTSHGVCTHQDLGPVGGGHHDPGTYYPVDLVLKFAREYLLNGW